MTTPIIVKKGDLFDAPPGSVLIHACNAVGSWGGDIAAKFKQRYPAAFKVYKEHCDTSRYGASDLVGTCLLIPPLHKDYRLDPAKRHWIACLFTSENYGRGVDPKRSILQATKISFCDLLEQYHIEKKNAAKDDPRAYPAPEILGLHSCKINSGAFKIPWVETFTLLNSYMNMKNAYRGGEKKLSLVVWEK